VNTIAQELFVIDSGSTNDTVELAIAAPPMSCSIPFKTIPSTRVSMGIMDLNAKGRWIMYFGIGVKIVISTPSAPDGSTPEAAI
jgi:hypothetical protein